ncbi:hypothetical protein D1007_53640 [Hordeum vulgare]|nr:hypothetical protein D1007_53640 [Hordeum vulgare]
MAYVASLIGVPLEIDYATLHRPASARVKFGCRSVDESPPVAEAVLGEHFYDFYFEVDQILVRDLDRGKSILNAGKHMDKEKKEDVDDNKNKKPRIDNSPRKFVEEKNENEYAGGKKEQIQESQESIESDVSLHTSLLIDSMAMEFMEDEKLVSGNIPDGDLSKKMKSPMSEMKSFADVVRVAPQVNPVDAEKEGCDTGKVEYMVESPDNAVEVEVIPTPPLATEENLRFSLRNVQSKMEDVQVKAAAAVRKRNAEGTLHAHNSFDALSNQEMMLVSSKMGVIIPDNDFVNIDIIRELENFRNNNARVEREDVVEGEEDVNNISVINANGVVTPLELGWMEEGNLEEDDFTVTYLLGPAATDMPAPTALVRPPLPAVALRASAPPLMPRALTDPCITATNDGPRAAVPRAQAPVRAPLRYPGEHLPAPPPLRLILEVSHDGHLI